MTRRIFYIHANPMPSAEANTINVARMAGGLAGHAPVTLLVRSLASAGRIRGYYGIDADCAIRPLKMLFWHWHMRLFPAVALAAGPLLARKDIVYTRNLRICRAALAGGFDTLLELHAPLDVGKREPEHGRRLLSEPRLRRIVAVSEPVARSVADSAGGDQAVRAKTLVLPHGVDIASYPDPLPLPARPSIVYAGNLHPGRGLSIIDSLAREFPRLSFAVVGGTRDRYIAATGDMPPANLELEAHLPPVRIAARLASADVLLAPYERRVYVDPDRRYRSDAFMAPLKIFDYLGAGAVILASDLPAIRDLLEDGTDALLIDPDRPDLWAEALRAVLADADLRARLLKGARRTAARIGSWRERARKALAGIDLEA